MLVLRHTLLRGSGDSAFCTNTHDFVNRIKKIEAPKSNQIRLGFSGASLLFPPTFVTGFLACHSLPAYKTVTCR